MNKTLPLMSLVMVSAIALGACEMTQRTLPPGHYENTSSSTDRYGTDRTKDTSTDVYYDEDGNKRVKSTTKVTTDPKGLFNKSTVTTKTSK